MMKWSVFFFLLGIIQVFAENSYSQQTQLTLKFKQARMEDVLNEIEDKSEFYFLYNEDIVNTKKTVTLNVKDEKIDKVLNTLFQETEISYTISDRQIVLTNTGNESAAKGNSVQQKPVTGRVTDASGSILPGVSVVVKGTTYGTVTDNNGKYSLSNVPENATLQFSFIGMKQQEIMVGNRNNLDVVMAEQTVGLDDVVVIGYGSRSKRDVTTAISTISADKITKVVASTPELLMQGQMSGVQVSGNQGNPNARPTVRIRGTNTWGVADPLYVIDGIPVKEWGAGVEGSQDQYTRGGINVMSMIDPNDIESISVLKDASASAIYGVRASNGVVLITTKKGRKEKTTVNYSQRFGFLNLRQEIKLLNAQQYVDFNNALYASDPSSDGSRSPLNEVFRPENPNYLGKMDTYNWQEAVKNKNAMTQDYSVNVSGGTEKVDYYLSFGYSDQDGVTIDNNLKRYNAAIKINTEINQYLRLGVNYRLSTAEARDMSGYIGSLLKTALTPVVQPIYDADGINGFAQVVNGYDDKGVWNNKVLYGSLTRYNMPGLFSMINSKNSSLRNMGNAYLEFEPIKGLKLKGTFNVDNFDNTNKGGTQYNSSYFKYDGGDPNNIPGSVGDYGLRVTNNLNIVSEFTLNYMKAIGKHNIDLLLNTMAQKYTANWTDVGTTYVTSTNPNLINLGGENLYTRVGGFKDISARKGYLGRIGYNYNTKYYLDATLRMDASTRFDPDYRWGSFPAASAAWRISRESFLEGAKWLNDLKLRAGWGKLGNDEVANMAYLSTINTAPTYAWGNNPSPRTDNPNTIGLGYTKSGAAVYGMATRDLQWEKTRTINIGFDATVINDLSLSFEYYSKLTSSLLQTVTLPPSTGVISMPQGNIGEVSNKGIEFNFNYKHTFGKVNVSAGANLTTVKNRVEKMYGGIPMLDRGIEVGQPLYYIRGYKVAGIFQSDAEAQDWMKKYEDTGYQTAKVTAGDFYFKDMRGAPKQQDIAEGINKYYSPKGDSIIDDYDRVNIGKTIPGYFYGFYLNADYKGFDISAQFTGVGNVQKINNTKSTFGMPYGEAMNHTSEVLNAWTPDNKNTNIPRMIWGDPAANGRFSDYFVEDADYLRLANLQLGYTLPETIYAGTNNILRNARIYLGCSNLFTITKFKGLDPEDQYNPAPLIIYTGLNIKF